jgi:hypothetical protein
VEEGIGWRIGGDGDGIRSEVAEGGGEVGSGKRRRRGDWWRDGIAGRCLVFFGADAAFFHARGLL